MHRYLYCANDPINRTDPGGEFFTFAGLILGNAIGDALRTTQYAAYGNAVAVVLTSIGGIIDVVWLWPKAKEFADDIHDNITDLPANNDKWEVEDVLDAYEEQQKEQYNAPN